MALIGKIVLLVHVAMAAVVVFLTVRVLRNDDNEKHGIVRILLHEEAKRFVPIPEVVGSIATVVKAAASSLATAAIATGESIVAQTLPSTISIGTKFACIDSDCSVIPGSDFRVGESLATLLSSASQIGDLETIMKRSPNFETMLAVGVGLVLTSTIMLLGSFKLRILGFASLGLSTIATVLCVTLTVFTAIICNVSQGIGSLLGAQVERGDVFEASIRNLVASVVMCLLALAHNIM
ncbi:hypothetical protein CLIM01_09429 [Colletotrichum limetticola]|uniref:SUR7 protein n=1 Tax=Colletotrichum limetticola TaxID=1209924 RepID=A0ABQ9PNV3_9PEZI|nr:hypothetical protein CLIM01_09429 [Colletotrichum limetticola]